MFFEGFWRGVRALCGKTINGQKRCDTQFSRDEFGSQLGGILEDLGLQK